MSGDTGADPGALPTTIGRYRILARLASDTVDDVYRGFDPIIERPVVVKVFHVRPADPADEPAIKQHFYREMQRVGLLRHHGIAALFDAGEQAGTLFMASEFTEGKSLPELLAGGVDWDLQARVSILTQLLDALVCACDAGVPHLNLKPSNVIVGADSTVKLGGFGVGVVVSRLAAAASAPPAQPSRYAAPERLRGDVGDARSDVFSVAQLALDILLLDEERAGRVPPPSPWLVTQGVSGDRWAAVFERALAENPAARFPTPDAFREALLPVLGMSEAHAWLERHGGDPLPRPSEESEAPTSLTPSDATMLRGRPGRPGKR